MILADVEATSAGSSEPVEARAMAKNAGLFVDEVVEALHQRLLRADAVVDRLGRHPGGFGDVANARAGVAAVREQAPGGLQDLRLGELCLTFSQAGWLVGHVSLSIT